MDYIKKLESFPNACIAYRILLTIPVTIASVERTFSKLKLIKSYLRLTVSQEKLSGLAILSTEKNMLEKIDYKSLINNFASKRAKNEILVKKIININLILYLMIKKKCPNL